jgi:hypothetical protein
MRLWDRFVVLVRGKRLGVLGPRAAGKTTLLQYLTSGSLPTEYRPTLGVEQVKAGRPRVSELGGSREDPGSGHVSLRRGRDVPGDSGPNLEAWEEVVFESDAVLYLFNVQLMMSGDQAHATRVLADCELVGGFFRKRKEQGAKLPKAVMVGTHCDLDPDYSPPSAGTEFLLYYSNVIQNADLIAAQQAISQVHAKPVQVVIGSLKNKASASDLSYRVLKQQLGF